MRPYHPAVLAAFLVLAGCVPPPPSPRAVVPPQPPSPPAGTPAPVVVPNANPTPTPPMNPAPAPPNPAPAPNPPPGPSPDEIKAKERRSILEGKFVRLEVTMVNKMPFYNLEVDLKNVSAKDIKQFQGGVWFYDDSGKDIYVIGDTGGPVKAGETARRGFSPFNLDDKTIATMKAHPDKVKVEFEAGKIEYADGTKKEYDRR